MKVLHSIRQQIWKTQQWPQTGKDQFSILIPKKGNAKECSKCHTITFISHASKVMLKILQARLQQHMNWELPDVQPRLKKANEPENTLVATNTLFQEHKRRFYTWTSPDDQYWNDIDYIICSQQWISSIQSAKIRPGVDYGSDHELLIAKFRFKLKKIGKITRPFRYDQNQIP